MKKSIRVKEKKPAQSHYMRILSSLRNPASSEYSKVVPKETKGLILGYD